MSPEERFALPCHRSASLCHVPVAVDPFPDVIWVFCGVVQGDSDEPWVQVRLGGQEANPVFLAAFELLQARDDLPHIGAGGKCRAAVMGRSPEGDSLIVELVDPFDDELVKQCRSGHALAGATGRLAR
jgi:hypothetical protein